MGAGVVGSATPSYADLLLPGIGNDAQPVVGTRFTGHVGLQAHYTDNINLASDSQARQSEEILEATPGFNLVHVSDRLQANLAYTFHSYNYDQDHALNSAYHQGQFGAAWQAVPQWFSLSSQASYDQRLVNPERSLDFNDLFSTGNLTDETTASITPKLTHDFAGVTLDAAYTYGIVNYSQPYDPFTDIDDSKRNSYRVALRPTQVVEDRNIEWGVSFDTERITYDHSFPYIYKQVMGSLGVPVGRRIVLLAEGGAESNLEESTTQGGLNSSFWRAGFRLAGDPRTQLDVMAGHRFFGNTYQAHIVHTARLLKFSVSYTEQPQTETERLTAYTTAPAATLPVDGVLPPSGAGPVRPIAQPYLLKLFDSTVALEGRLTTITLGAFNFDQRYLALTNLGEKDRGVRLVVLRRFGPRMSGTLAAARIETFFAEDPNGKNDDDTVSFTLARQMSRSVSLTARALYLWRSGPAAGDYHAALITLGAFAAF